MGTVRKVYQRTNISSLDIHSRIYEFNQLLKYLFEKSLSIANSNVDSFASSKEIACAVDQLFPAVSAEQIKAYCSNAVKLYGTTTPGSFSCIMNALNRLSYSDYLTDDGSLYLAAFIRWTTVKAVESAVHTYLCEEGLIDDYDE